RGFNNEEKQFIHDQLIQESRLLFQKWGLLKTTVSDITKTVGIAPGSFYAFFSSKEALYFQILESEENNIRVLLFESVADDTCKNEAVQRQFLQVFKKVQQSLVIHDLFNEKIMTHLFRKLSEETLSNHASKDFQMAEDLIQKWKRDGFQVQKEADFVCGVLR